jgi:hypothetical protein
MLCMVDMSQRIPKDHPLRRIKSLADEILRQMGPTFGVVRWPRHHRESQWDPGGHRGDLGDRDCRT